MSLRQKKFNEAMVTYFMPRQQTCQVFAAASPLQQVLYPRYVLLSYISKELGNIIIQLFTLNPIKQPSMEHIIGAPEAQPR
jgi:hypothetical protein